jgi:hypothetical protein
MGIIRHQFHGCRWESENSYVTTEFATLWFLPLWPVASHRVLKNKPTVLGNSSSDDDRINILPIQWGQALEGWLISFAILGGLLFISAFLYFVTKFRWSE